MIPENFKNFTSYSRYRGFGSTYALSDEYFAKIVDGNLICTDNECDIDCDGNIVLVTPSGDVMHIGVISVPERGKVSCSFDSSNNLHLSWREYYDVGLKHSGVREEIIDTHLTEERKFELIVLRLHKTLAKSIKGYTGGSYCNELSLYRTKTGILLKGYCSIRTRYSRDTKYFEQAISFIPKKGFVLMPDKNGEDGIFKVLIKRDLMLILEEFNKSIGLGKNTSFMLVGVDVKSCRILDVKDNTVETVSKEEVIKTIKSGYEVIGVDNIDGTFYFRRVKD